MNIMAIGLIINLADMELNSMLMGINILENGIMDKDKGLELSKRLQG
eukprot:CAMPEP_0201282824 /NCGR_PEP_ID=MMETSP1317-20130820/6776_1 /ASSEMBLY_ACC=CAM_ASM_000770 /TAXON_ID=187299 /ORGANISM="Undescribed Undescribed, Strain Undescribed" /LENGTH=46 /DNA_ID= /DNA_START= /DNA_END= /DNA_ORIENTATION=